MPERLARGVVKRMSSPSVTPESEVWLEQPIVQVVMCKDIVSNKTAGPNPRKRGAISDGEHYTQVMFTTQLNDLIDRGDIKRFTIIRITKMTLNVVQDKRLIIILGADRVMDFGSRIGSPTAADGKPVVDVESPSSASVVPERSLPRSTSSAQPLSKPGGQAVSKPNGNFGPVFAIEGLTPYQNKWTIKARVINKSEMRTWQNTKGDGKLFSVTFMDETGEIRATAFNKAADDLFPRIEVGKVYFVSKARVNVAKKKFSHNPNEYEITLETSSEVEEAADDSNVPTQKYIFIPLNELDKLQKDAICDVIGVVKDVGEIGKITTKTQRELVKRDLTIVDQSEFSIRLTLWGAQAESFNDHTNPVVAFKSVKVGDFQGRTLSLLSSGSLQVNPELDATYKLRSWYDNKGAAVTYRSYSSGAGSGPAASAFNRKEMRTLDQVKSDESIGGEGKEFFSLKASVMHIRTGEKPSWYPACVECGKKVVQVDNKWSCEKCKKNVEHTNRYILSVALADHSSQAWFTAFNETAQAILGLPADELAQLKEQDDTRFNDILKTATGATYLMSCRAKQDSYDGQERMRYSINRLQKVNCSEEAEELVKFIESYH